MLFVQKGYCRFCGSRCRRFKVKDGQGECKHWYGGVIRNEKTGLPKHVSSDKNVNIKAPKWCPKLQK